MVAHNRGEGGYRAPTGNGSVTSSLTGFYAWSRHALSERVSVWGVAGYGEGTLTLTPGGADGNARAPIRTDLDLMMGALGLRGVLVQAPETGGLELAVKADAMGVRTGTAKAPGLAATQAEVTRLGLGLEGSRPFDFEDGAVLTPSVEIGVRHDGGDAETGFGADIGGGVAWSDPGRALSAELRGRGLLSHEAKGLRERGITAALSFDPTPGSDRGLKLTMGQTVSAQATGGMDALFGRRTLAGLAANDNGSGGGELAQRRFETTLGYGLSAFGDRFTMTPEAGFGLSNAGSDYRLGWRLTRGGRHGGSFELSIEARRHENDNAVAGSGSAEHALAVKLTARW